MKGWIKLHRKVRDNPIFNDMRLFRLMIICLTEASHKDHEQLVGSQLVHLKSGEFVTGRFDLHRMYLEGLKHSEYVSEITVWRWLRKLENLDFLNIKSNNKFTVVSITNWSLYQNDDQENEQQMNNKRSTNEQQMITNKNGKNVKNGENEKKIYDDDENFPRLHSVSFFENNFNNHSPFILDSIEHWVNDLSDDIVLAAMKLTLKRGNKKFGYLESILKEWFAQGIKTLDDAKAYENERQEKMKASYEPKGGNKSWANQRVAPMPKSMHDEPKKEPSHDKEREARIKDMLDNLGGGG